MGKILFILAMTLTSLLSNAAKPVEVEIDQIFYRLDLDEMTASVINANEKIESAIILNRVNYEDNSYAVTLIGRQAFKGCNKLKSVVIPNGIKEIGYESFYMCSSLNDVEIPNSVIKIDAYAFCICTTLSSVKLPSYLIEIGNNAFKSCKSLKRVDIENLRAWCNVKLNGSYSNPIYVANADLYENNSLIENLVIPEGITHILQQFMGCNSIKTVNIPSYISKIGYEAFYGCQNLEIVTIDNGVEELADWSFAYCPQLKIINVFSVTPPLVIAENSPVGTFFMSYPEYMTLHVPKGTKETYEKTDGWKDFGTIIDDLPNESGVENILIDNTQPMEIYNLEGECVFSGIGNYELKSGFYIIRQGPKCKKIIIE